jgi:uncharacterized protein (TIGR02284 family)
MAENDARLNGKLEPLIEALQNSERIYTTAAGNALDDRLRELFEARATQRDAFAEALRRQSWSVEKGDDGKGPLDTLRRGSMTIRATMTIEPEKTDRLLVEETQQADRDLLEQYRDLLSEDWERGLEATLQRQYHLVQAAHSNLATMLGTPEGQMVFGLFTTVEHAEDAVRRLEQNGFARQNIDILAQEEAVRSLLEDPRPEATKESATAGAVGGAAVGGLIGLIAGASTIVVMGVGTVLTGGALAAALGITAAGAGIGASYGGLFGALMGWGISEGDIQHFVEGVRDGNILVAVRAERQRGDAAMDIMRQAGATFVRTHQEEPQS